MKQLCPPDPAIGALWMQPAPALRYRPIRYLLFSSSGHGMLVHHTVTGECIRVTRDEASVLRSSSVPYSADLEELIRRHFLIPEDTLEHRTVSQLRAALTLLKSDHSLTEYTILPTTACNAGCFYCYEAGYTPVFMTEDTIRDLTEFMKRHRGEHPLRLHWFGGEPLLAASVIDRICTELKDIQIPFTSSITTNGSLFTPEIIENAAGLWNTDTVQITLDGPKEEYERVKKYPSSLAHPYETVHRNILLLLQAGISVKIRLNFGPHNAESLFALLDELSDRYSAMENITVYAHPLFSCNTAAGEELHPLWEPLQAKLHALFPAPAPGLPRLRVFHCMADRPDTVLVSPRGLLGKCEHRIEEDLGNLCNGFHARENADRGNTEPGSDCLQCPLYPTCATDPVCPQYAPCTKQERLRKIQKVSDSLASCFSSEPS